MKYWDSAWSLVEGCTPVSEACDNCWLAGISHRFDVGKRDSTRVNETDESGRFTGRIKIRTDRLNIPLKRKTPTVYAIWSDLFHEKVPHTFIYDAIDNMIMSIQHTFLILTKRPKIMRDILMAEESLTPNIYFGVTVENQKQADKRIPILLQIPGKKFVSIEPMLSSIDISKWIGYNPINERERKDSLSGGQGRRIEDRQTGSNLESSKKGLEQMGKMCPLKQMQRSSGRTSNPGRISSSKSNVQPKKISCLSTQGSVDALQWNNTKRDDYQSQKWDKKRQQIRKPRNSKPFSTDETCQKCIEEKSKDLRTKRREKFNGKINKTPSNGNSSEKVEWGKSKKDSKRLQDSLPNSVRHCSPTTLETPINLIIVGAESGRKRRECKIEWIESVIEQCKAAGVPTFVKQIHLMGRADANSLKLTDDIDLFPKSLRIRELPF